MLQSSIFSPKVSIHMSNVHICSVYCRKTRQIGQFPGTRDSREKGVPGTGIPGSMPAGHIPTLVKSHDSVDILLLFN